MWDSLRFSIGFGSSVAAVGMKCKILLMLCLYPCLKWQFQCNTHGAELKICFSLNYLERLLAILQFYLSSLPTFYSKYLRFKQMDNNFTWRYTYSADVPKISAKRRDFSVRPSVRVFKFEKRLYWYLNSDTGLVWQISSLLFFINDRIILSRV